MSASDALRLPDSDLLRKDCDADLRLFRSVVPGVFAEALPAEWEQRRAAREHCYTRVEDGVLVSYVWMIERQLHSWLSCVRQGFEFPPDSAVVYDLYTDPKFRQSCYYQSSAGHPLQSALTSITLTWSGLLVSACTWPSEPKIMWSSGPPVGAMMPEIWCDWPATVISLRTIEKRGASSLEL